VSEVLNGLAQVTPPGEKVGRLAIIPIGSGNDFADMAGCPRHLKRAAAAIARGATRQVDLGHATIRAGGATLQRYFDNNVGVGFEASATLESYKIKYLRGVPLYALAALRALRSCPIPTVTTTWETVEGTRHHCTQPTFLISVGNTRRTGGGFYLTPDARLDDGQLDVGIAAAVSRLRVLWLLPKALRGKHTSDPAVTLVRCRRLWVEAAAPMPLHVDGEVITAVAEQIEIELQPGRLELIVEQSTLPPGQAQD
jgi:YegS/Rv2252/BmrU family lipid kinase